MSARGGRRGACGCSREAVGFYRTPGRQVARRVERRQGKQVCEQEWAVFMGGAEEMGRKREQQGPVSTVAHSLTDSLAELPSGWRPAPRLYCAAPLFPLLPPHHAASGCACPTLSTCLLQASTPHLHPHNQRPSPVHSHTNLSAHPHALHLLGLGPPHALPPAAPHTHMHHTHWEPTHL